MSPVGSNRMCAAAFGKLLAVDSDASTPCGHPPYRGHYDDPHPDPDQREAVVAVRLTAGKDGDDPQLMPLLDDGDRIWAARGVTGRGFRLLADKVYSHPRTRTPNFVGEESR